jgi:hypothetical protein
VTLDGSYILIGDFTIASKAEIIDLLPDNKEFSLYMAELGNAWWTK